jgi:hypothetical protein
VGPPDVLCPADAAAGVSSGGGGGVLRKGGSNRAGTQHAASVAR